jgi:hypothetical protein
MSVDIKFSIGLLLGVLIAVVWYECKARGKMG